MTTRLKHFIRRVTVLTLYYSGLLWLIVAFRLRSRAVVLTYHRVLPAETDTFSADGIVVRPATFARQMAFLRRHFRLLSIDALADALQTGRTLPRMSCVVTFDDGWVDNFEHALPIIQRENIPAVIFVAGHYIDTNRCFWQERLIRQLFQAVQGEGPSRKLVEQYIGPGIGKFSPVQQRQAIRAAIDRLKDRPAAEVEALEQGLANASKGNGPLSAANGYDRFMSWCQVAALTKNSAASVGSHGCSHTPLTRLREEQVEQELQVSRRDIESAIGKSVIAIAYPNGNYNDSIIELARQAGYRLGFTTDRGYVDTNSNPLKLCRINIHEASTATMPDFLCILAGVFSGYRTFKAARG